MPIIRNGNTSRSLLEPRQGRTPAPIPPRTTATVAAQTVKVPVTTVPVKITVPVKATIASIPPATTVVVITPNPSVTLSSTSTSTTTTSSSASPTSVIASSTSSHPPKPSTVTVTLSASKTLSSAKASSSSTSTPAGGLGAGSIVGIIGGCILAVALISFTISFFIRRWRRGQGENGFDSRQFRRSAILLDDPMPTSTTGSGQMLHAPQYTAPSVPQYPRATYGQEQIPYSDSAVAKDPSYPSSYLQRQAYSSPPQEYAQGATGLQRSATIYNPEDAYGGI